MSADPVDSNDPRPEPANSTATSVSRHDKDDATGFLWKAVNELPEDCRTVILLRQQMNLGFMEIAEQIHCSPDFVRTLWGRAILMLGEKLDGKEW